MFELPSFGQAVQLIFIIGMIFWIHKTEKEAKEEKKVRHKEEKALLEDVMFLTTTRVKFQRHLWIILDKVASYKIQRVTITDEKEIPQSVLLPYAEYQLLQNCYDRQEALELAPLIEERMKNNATKENRVSQEEMMKRMDEKMD